MIGAKGAEKWAKKNTGTEWNKSEMRPTLEKTAGENGKQNFLT